MQLEKSKPLLDTVKYTSPTLAGACDFWWDWSSMLIHGGLLCEQVGDLDPDDAEEIVAEIGSHVAALVDRASDSMSKSLFNALGVLYGVILTLDRATDALGDRDHEIALKLFRSAITTVQGTRNELEKLTLPSRLRQFMDLMRLMDGMAQGWERRTQAEMKVYSGDRVESMRLARESISVLEDLKASLTPSGLGGIGFEVDVDDEIEEANKYLTRVSVGEPGVLAMSSAVAKIATPDLLDATVSQLRELTNAFMNGQWISSLALTGGVLESLLLAALQRRETEALGASQAPKRNSSVKPLTEWVLAEYIRVAEELRLLPAGLIHLSNGLREFRNLIHPGKRNRSKQSAGEDEARAAVAVFRLVAQSLSK